jgi:carbon monoxide dehydrogenase subunit G
MSLVRAKIDIDRPRAEVFAAVLDPELLGRWVTIHRRVNRADEGPLHEGYEMEQTLHLRGANFKVRWELTEHTPPSHATWEGRGPAGSYARTSYALAARDGDERTRFSYENEFKVPGGFLGRSASRALVGGISEREALRSLERLKALLEKG